MKRGPLTLDLYLDESGLFIETSTNADERRRAYRENSLHASQLAGVVVPHGALTAAAATEVLEACMAAAGERLGPVAHFKDLSADGGYDKAVETFVAEAAARKWQPVRLVNTEAIEFGDRVATYTHMVAELVLRIFEACHAKGYAPISLNLTGAEVFLKREGSNAYHMTAAQYRERLESYLGFAAVRHGASQMFSSWKVTDLRVIPAMRHRELQVCDLVSNASYANYRKCGERTAKLLKKAFGQFDQSMIVGEILLRLDSHLNANAIGSALVTLAEPVLQPAPPDETVTGELGKRRDVILQRLARLPGPARRTHLQQVTNWLELLVEHFRSLDTGYKASQWLLKTIEPRLRQALPKPLQTELDAWKFRLHHLALATANHRGALVDARTEATALDELMPAVARNWEDIPTLGEALAAQAVHYTDAFEFETACQRMKAVAELFGNVSRMFPELMPEVFKTPVRSDGRGKALGTWLQAEILAAPTDPDRCVAARRLSDEAIREFMSADDRLRQFQYRSQLESASGDFSAALHFLARSLKMKEGDHQAVAGAILALRTQPVAQGFALLHWLRLGAGAIVADAPEAQPFLAAWQTPGVAETPWVRGTQSEYPVHGILRRAAIVALALNDRPASQRALHLLQTLGGTGSAHLALDMIRLAARTECAAMLLSKDGPSARRMLDCDERGAAGVLQMTKTLKKSAPEQFRGFHSLLTDWERILRQALQLRAPEARQALLQIGARVGH